MRQDVLAALLLGLVGLAACLPAEKSVDNIVPESAHSEDQHVARRISELETGVVGQEQEGSNEERMGGLEEVVLGNHQKGTMGERLMSVEAAILASKKAEDRLQATMAHPHENAILKAVDTSTSSDAMYKSVKAKANTPIEPAAEKKVPRSIAVNQAHQDLVAVADKASAEAGSTDEADDTERDKTKEKDGLKREFSLPSSSVPVKVAPPPPPPPPAGKAASADYCDMKTQMCYYDSNKECDKDSDCVSAKRPPPPSPPPPAPTPQTGCDYATNMCYNDNQEECTSDVDCFDYKCENAPSQWIALLFQVFLAPLGAGFGYIGRWGMMALYLNATFLPCLLSCTIVCCFPSKLEDEAYRMPAAVWIMVFWGCLQVALYIWSVWQFGDNSIVAGYPYEGCRLRNNWHF